MQSNRIVSVRRYAQPPPCGEVEKRPSRFSGGGNGASHRPPPEICSRCSQISASPQGGGKIKGTSTERKGSRVNVIATGFRPTRSISAGASADADSPAAFQTDIPARLDRLPWTRIHSLIVIALGVSWVLDGLEVTLVGSLSGAIGGAHGLHLSAGEIGLAASAYLAGAVLGALCFGGLTDSF